MCEENSRANLFREGGDACRHPCLSYISREPDDQLEREHSSGERLSFPTRRWRRPCARLFAELNSGTATQFVER